MLILRCLLVVVGAFLVVSNVFALGVSPTLLELSPQSAIASLMVSNDGDIPQTIQIEAVNWKQQQEHDEYTPTDDLIITPQIFIILPQSTQLVRVGLENAIYKNREQAYRLFVQEVIPKVKINRHGLRMALRISLPVIIKSTGPTQQLLSWKLKKNDSKSLTITAWNKGNNILFINAIQVLSAGGEPITSSHKTFVYLLPGSKKTWTIKQDHVRQPKSIKATINSKVVLTNVL